MSERISRNTLNELIKMEKQICLSLYMPTHRSFPEREQDPIRYKNMLRELRDRLHAQHPEAEAATLLKPFEALLDDHDFWIYQRDGIAVLGGRTLLQGVFAAACCARVRFCELSPVSQATAAHRPVGGQVSGTVPRP